MLRIKVSFIFQAGFFLNLYYHTKLWVNRMEKYETKILGHFFLQEMNI